MTAQRSASPKQAPDLRFPAQAHVRTAAEFARCFASGKRANARRFGGIFRLHDERDVDAGIRSARLGMAISRKVDKRAVERNRLRRLIREWFRHQLSDLAAGDLVITGRPAARGSSAESVFAELDHIAGRLGLMQTRNNGKMAGPSQPSSRDDGA